MEIFTMKNLLIGLTLSLFATAAFAQQGGGGMDVTATNDSSDATAVGGDTLAGTAEHHDIDVLSVLDGVAIAGSILVNPADCDCYDELTLVNTSKNSLAVGSAAAGSIVIR